MKKVFVGLSGGVDSSVAAHRLIKQGYDVTGVFIKVWQPDFLVCNWEKERLDAMRVAAHLNIPFLTCDAEVAYRDEVAQYFIDEYKAGRTPNPDVMCNQYVKFGRFLDFALEKGADFIATGHYAQIERVEDQCNLLRGVDRNKDQSYFLWTLTNEQLSHVLLPVGNTKKPEIREEAELANLPTASKPDSQGICFLGQVDIESFLSHYVQLKPGKVMNEKGEVIGTHNGALVYTKGQRHGLQITSHEKDRGIYYVTGKDIDQNLVYASSIPPVIDSTNQLAVTNYVLRTNLKDNQVIEVQTRYRQTPFKAKVELAENTLKFTPEEVTEAVAKGQSAVFYLGDVCLGGGIIA